MSPVQQCQGLPITLSRFTLNVCCNEAQDVLMPHQGRLVYFSLPQPGCLVFGAEFLKGHDNRLFSECYVDVVSKLFTLTATSSLCQ